MTTSHRRRPRHDGAMAGSPTTAHRSQTKRASGRIARASAGGLTGRTWSPLAAGGFLLISLVIDIRHTAS